MHLRYEFTNVDARFRPSQGACQSESGDDAHEVGALECGAADETAVHVGLAEDLLGVGGLAAATVEDRAVFSYFLAIFILDDAADMGVHVLGLFGGSGLAGADGPDGLVSEDEFAEIFGSEMEESFLDLLGDYLVISAVVTLFEFLADAEYGGETLCESQVDFGFEDFRGLAVVLTALRVAEDDISGTGRSHHVSRNLAGVGTLDMVGAVFGTKTELVLVDNGGYGSQMGERSADDHVALRVDAFEGLVNFFCQSHTFGKGGVHLPVTCYDVLSHDYFEFVLVVFQFQSANLHFFCDIFVVFLN